MEYNNWDEIPLNWKNIKPIRKVKYTNSPFDKGLISILEKIAGSEDLRPTMMGINFDENGIVATDANVLALLPSPNEKYFGNYGTTKQYLKHLAKNRNPPETEGIIDGKYPNYMGIIPTENKNTTRLDVFKMLQFCNVSSNVQTHKLSFSKAVYFDEESGDKKDLFFINSLMKRAMEFFLKVGLKQIFVSISGSVVLFTENNSRIDRGITFLLISISEEAARQQLKYIDNGLLSINLHFNFQANEIINADGSVAEYREEYKEKKDSLTLTKDELRFLKRINPPHFYLNGEEIQGYNLDDNGFFSIRKKTNEIGYYTMLNNALVKNKSDYKISENTRVRIDRIKEQAKPIDLTIGKDALIHTLDVLKFYGSLKSGMASRMKGVAFQVMESETVKLFLTNGHVLALMDISDFSTNKSTENKYDFILNVTNLSEFLKLCNETIHFEGSTSELLVTDGQNEFTIEPSSIRVPAYQSLIPEFFDDEIKIDLESLNDCLSSPIVKSEKMKDSKDFVAIRADENGNLKAGDEPVCKLNIEFNKVPKLANDYRSLFLIMPLMDKDKLPFSFNLDYLQVVKRDYKSKTISFMKTDGKHINIIDATCMEFQSSKTKPANKLVKKFADAGSKERVLKENSDFFEHNGEKHKLPSIGSTFDFGDGFEKIASIKTASNGKTYIASNHLTDMPSTENLHTIEDYVEALKSEDEIKLRRLENENSKRILKLEIEAIEKEKASKKAFKEDLDGFENHIKAIQKPRTIEYFNQKVNGSRIIDQLRLANKYGWSFSKENKIIYNTENGENYVFNDKINTKLSADYLMWLDEKGISFKDLDSNTSEPTIDKTDQLKSENLQNYLAEYIRINEKYDLSNHRLYLFKKKHGIELLQITPDHIREMQDYKDLKSKVDKNWKELQEMNKYNVKNKLFSSNDRFFRMQVLKEYKKHIAIKEKEIENNTNSILTYNAIKKAIEALDVTLEFVSKQEAKTIIEAIESLEISMEFL